MNPAPPVTRYKLLTVKKPFFEKAKGDLRRLPDYKLNFLVARTGIEPVLSALRGRRVNQLHQRALRESPDFQEVVRRKLYNTLTFVFQSFVPSAFSALCLAGQRLR